eukprot:359358-Chlamydomonas_euryale.AAC.4
MRHSRHGERKTIIPAGVAERREDPHQHTHTHASAGSIPGRQASHAGRGHSAVAACNPAALAACGSSGSGNAALPACGSSGNAVRVPPGGRRAAGGRTAIAAAAAGGCTTVAVAAGGGRTAVVAACDARQKKRSGHGCNAAGQPRRSRRCAMWRRRRPLATVPPGAAPQAQRYAAACGPCAHPRQPRGGGTHAASGRGLGACR